MELYDEFVKGRKTRGGQPLPADEMPRPEPVVTLVAPDAVDEFLGARSLRERTAHLRRLRDEGLLICHGRGRLYQYVRGQGVKTAYVFRCESWAVPRIDPASRGSGSARVLLAD